jgi:aconitate hydratase 2/2-methylisocitrate dehydratase
VVTLIPECQKELFGADSGTVALALATEKVYANSRISKVTFKGDMKNYMDFRDVVHATQSQMLKQFGGEMFSGSNYRGI